MGHKGLARWGWGLKTRERMWPLSQVMNTVLAAKTALKATLLWLGGDRPMDRLSTQICSKFRPTKQLSSSSLVPAPCSSVAHSDLGEGL